MISCVDFFADIASIVTAVIALLAWIKFRGQSRDRQSRLEEYLFTVKSKRNSGEGLKSVPHLMARLYMTEAQVYDAAFNSKVIKALPKKGVNGLAEQVMFQHNPEARAKEDAE